MPPHTPGYALLCLVASLAGCALTPEPPSLGTPAATEALKSSVDDAQEYDRCASEEDACLTACGETYKARVTAAHEVRNACWEDCGRRFRFGSPEHVFCSGPCDLDEWTEVDDAGEERERCDRRCILDFYSCTGFPIPPDFGEPTAPPHCAPYCPTGGARCVERFWNWSLGACDVVTDL